LEISNEEDIILFGSTAADGLATSTLGKNITTAATPPIKVAAPSTNPRSDIFRVFCDTFFPLFRDLADCGILRDIEGSLKLYPENTSN
jgi:hypothetical protein